MAIPRNRRRTTTLAVLVATAAQLLSGVGVAHADATGGSTVPLLPILRGCDHGEFNPIPRLGTARAVAIVRSGGGTVTSDVSLGAAQPFTAYDVRLIQAPRPSFPSCNGGDPGVTAGVLMTDAGGNGTVTLQGARAAGATGAWVFVSRPAEFSQTPAEFYTGDFVAPI